jgi:hypothetical protein
VHPALLLLHLLAARSVAQPLLEWLLVLLSDLLLLQLGLLRHCWLPC